MTFNALFSLSILLMRDGAYAAGILLAGAVAYAISRFFTRARIAFLYAMLATLALYLAWYKFRFVPYWAPQIRL